MTRPPVPRVLVVMGVSGCGKSTVAAGLSQRLGWPFQEGDDLHPAANRAKMRGGIPLDDADRAPWLALVADWVARQRSIGSPGIITCSALKRAYRQTIMGGVGGGDAGGVGGGPGVLFVYLQVTRARLLDHLGGRRHAFMPASLLDSQLATLEEPGADEPAITVPLAIGPVAAGPDQTIATILRRLATIDSV